VDLALVKDVSIVIAGIVAFIGLLSGTVEYYRRGRQDRAQHFLELRRRFLEDESFRKILDLLATDDLALAEVSVQERRNLVGYFEEVALMVDSRLIRLEVAHYMYGYYVCMVAQSKHFWVKLDPDSPYWAVFRGFAVRLQNHKIEDETRKPLRF
jgi:hypothetical protein